MTIGWNTLSQCYEFDTGLIFGGIEPYTNYHGVCGLMHRDEKVDVVRPKKAFLNAEYYLSPGSGSRMLPRRISLERQTTHEVSGDSVVICFPPEPEYEFAMELKYTPHDDAVDLQMTISPTKDVPQFEMFFASYVCETLNATWIPLRNADGTEEWVSVGNRQIMNHVFGAVRDEAERRLIDDGRWGRKLDERDNASIEDRPFSRPVWVVRNRVTKSTLTFLCDPRPTTYLAGQYHGWDTAHDWCFGADLVTGRPMIAHARMVYRPFASAEELLAGVQKLWTCFETDLAQSQETAE